MEAGDPVKPWMSKIPVESPCAAQGCAPARIDIVTPINGQASSLPLVATAIDGHQIWPGFDSGMDALHAVLGAQAHRDRTVAACALQAVD
jgi:hypothetical protein